MSNPHMTTVLAMAAIGMPMRPTCDGGYAYDQIVSTPTTDLRIPKRKKNVNRPRGSKRRRHTPEANHLLDRSER